MPTCVKILLSAIIAFFSIFFIALILLLLSVFLRVLYPPIIKHYPSFLLSEKRKNENKYEKHKEENPSAAVLLARKRGKMIYRHEAIYVGNSHVLIAGGMIENKNGRFIVRESSSYDAYHRFSGNGAVLNVPRTTPLLFRLPDNRVMIAGGSTGYSCSDRGSKTRLVKNRLPIEVYDLKNMQSFNYTNRKWELVDGPRFYCDEQIIPMGTNPWLVVRPIYTDSIYLSETRIYEWTPPDGKLIPVGKLPTPREKFELLKLKSKRILIAGGHERKYTIEIDKKCENECNREYIRFGETKSVENNYIWDNTTKRIKRVPVDDQKVFYAAFNGRNINRSVILNWTLLHDSTVVLASRNKGVSVWHYDLSNGRLRELSSDLRLWANRWFKERVHGWRTDNDGIDTLSFQNGLLIIRGDGAYKRWDSSGLVKEGPPMVIFDRRGKSIPGRVGFIATKVNENTVLISGGRNIVGRNKIRPDSLQLIQIQQ